MTNLLWDRWEVFTHKGQNYGVKTKGDVGYVWQGRRGMELIQKFDGSWKPVHPTSRIALVNAAIAKLG